MALFSTKIKVPVSTLQDHADKICRYADDNEDIFDRIENSLICLRDSGEWQGESFEAALEAAQENQKKFKEAIKEMRELGEFLKDFVSEITARDKETERKITAI